MEDLGQIRKSRGAAPLMKLILMTNLGCYPPVRRPTGRKGCLPVESNTHVS